MYRKSLPRTIASCKYDLATKVQGYPVAGEECNLTLNAFYCEIRQKNQLQLKPSKLGGFVFLMQFSLHLHRQFHHKNIKSMAKIKKVEAWVKRIDNESFQFIFRDAETNKPSYESQIYTRNSTAIIGAKRHAKKNNIKIKWLPKR